MKKSKDLDYSPSLFPDELAKAEQEKEIRIQKAKRHNELIGIRVEYKKLLVEYNKAFLGYIHAKPKEKEVRELIMQFTKKIQVDTCKFLLRTFGVPFKVKDMMSGMYKEMTTKVMTEHIKTPEELAKLILFLNRQPFNPSINCLENIKNGIKRLK